MNVTAKKCHNNGRIDEDDGVGDDHERRTLNLSAVLTLASFLDSGQVIAKLEQYTRHNGKSSGEACQCVGDGHRTSICARCSIATGPD